MRAKGRKHLQGRRATSGSPCTSHLFSPGGNSKPTYPRLSLSGLGSATHSFLPARIWPALPRHLHQLLTLQGSLEMPLSRSARGSITQPAPPRHIPKAAWQTESCPGMKPKGHSSQCKAAKPSNHLIFSGCQSRGSTFLMISALNGNLLKLILFPRSQPH